MPRAILRSENRVIFIIPAYAKILFLMLFMAKDFTDVMLLLHSSASSSGISELLLDDDDDDDDDKPIGQQLF